MNVLLTNNYNVYNLCFLLTVVVFVARFLFVCGRFFSSVLGATDRLEPSVDTTNFELCGVICLRKRLTCRSLLVIYPTILANIFRNIHVLLSIYSILKAVVINTQIITDRLQKHPRHFVNTKTKL